MHVEALGRPALAPEHRPERTLEVTSAESVLVADLLNRAQAGAQSAVLEQVETELRAATGDLADGSPGLHFVRAVCLLMQATTSAVVLPACDLMLAAARRERQWGWLSCAYSLRACQVLRGEGELSPEESDYALQNLVAAEVALEEDVDDPIQACNAHANISVGYEVLRLYELAEPHCQASHAASLKVPDGAANPQLWSGNLAALHLRWGLELYRIGQADEAEKHSQLAAQAADLAVSETSMWGDDDTRLAMVKLLHDCALADSDQVEGVADRLRTGIDYLQSVESTDATSFAAPFLAVALSRTGRHAEAITSITKAWEEYQGVVDVMTDAAISHTRAMLLASNGSPEATAALDYGDVVARILWRERLRTLYAARTMRDYEKLRAVHEEVALSASTDPLTGLANRRSLDILFTELAESPTTRRVAVLLIDVDRFKEINDTFGHDAGDDALRRVAGAISGSVRGNDTVARLGGDEFVVVLPDATTASATLVAERAVRAVADLGTIATISVGIAIHPSPDVRAALAEADTAMYVAKRAGGGQAHLAD